MCKRGLTFGIEVKAWALLTSESCLFHSPWRIYPARGAYAYNGVLELTLDFHTFFLAGFTSDHTCIESTLYTLNTWVVWSENRPKSESCICGNPAWALTSPPPHYNYVCANFCRNLKTWKRCFSHAGENVGLVHLHSSRFVLIYLDSLCYTTGHHPTTSRKRHYVL